MAEETAPEVTTKPVKAEKPKLARAAESGDAGVQNLLARRTGYGLAGLKDKVAEVDRELADLGFTAT